MSTTPIGDPPALSTVQGEWGVGSLGGLAGHGWYNPGAGNFGGLPINLRAAIGKYSTNPSYQVNHNWVSDMGVVSPPVWSLDQPQNGSGQLYVQYGGSFVDGNNYLHIFATALPGPYVPKQAYNSSNGWLSLTYIGVQSTNVGSMYVWVGFGFPPGGGDNPQPIIWGV